MTGTCGKIVYKEFLEYLSMLLAARPASFARLTSNKITTILIASSFLPIKSRNYLNTMFYNNDGLFLLALLSSLEV